MGRVCACVALLEWLVLQQGVTKHERNGAAPITRNCLRQCFAGRGACLQQWTACVLHQLLVHREACTIVQRVRRAARLGVQDNWVLLFPSRPAAQYEAPTPSHRCCERPGVPHVLYTVQLVAVTASCETNLCEAIMWYCEG